MLVLTRRPAESLVFTFPYVLDIKPVTVTVFENGKIGIDVPGEEAIVWVELLDR